MLLFFSLLLLFLLFSCFRFFSGANTHNCDYYICESKNKKIYLQSSFHFMLRVHSIFFPDSRSIYIVVCFCVVPCKSTGIYICIFDCMPCRLSVDFHVFFSLVKSRHTPTTAHSYTRWASIAIYLYVCACTNNRHHAIDIWKKKKKTSGKKENSTTRRTTRKRQETFHVEHLRRYHCWSMNNAVSSGISCNNHSIFNTFAQ